MVSLSFLATFMVGCILLSGLATAGNCSDCTPIGTNPAIETLTAMGTNLGGREGSFACHAFGGRYIWLPPLFATKSPVGRLFVIRLDPRDGSRTAFDFPSTITAPVNTGYQGAVYDNHDGVWFAPTGPGGYVVKLNTTDGSMTAQGNTVPTQAGPISNPDGAFSGGFFDGQNVWFSPQVHHSFMLIDYQTASKSGVWSWPAGYDPAGINGMKFTGVAYDGTRAWVSPWDAPALMSVHVATKTISAHTNWPAGFTKQGGSFTRPMIAGRSLWLPPRYATHIIRVDLDTHTMTGFNAWPSGFVRAPAGTPLGNYGFAEASYDGEALWFTPGGANQIVRLNPTDGSMLGYNNGGSLPLAGWKHTAAMFDGKTLWLLPSHAKYFVKVTRCREGQSCITPLPVTTNSVPETPPLPPVQTNAPVVVPEAPSTCSECSSPSASEEGQGASSRSESSESDDDNTAVIIVVVVVVVVVLFGGGVIVGFVVIPYCTQRGKRRTAATNETEVVSGQYRGEPVVGIPINELQKQPV